MLPSRLSDDERRRLRNRVLLVGAIFMATWLTFFDSHSLAKRIGWHRELGQLQEENAYLRSEIERLEEEVARGLSDEMVEKIAREEYGMRRPGETVYRVEHAD